MTDTNAHATRCAERIVPLLNELGYQTAEIASRLSVEPEALERQTVQLVFFLGEKATLRDDPVGCLTRLFLFGSGFPARSSTGCCRRNWSSS
ncbi:hypothetical protein [Krasilnikovia sp. M28-CT-15]|uniref:hypothetical protein n=1 Tax=Krasilnikovia sp. M28-CT-15 TaxID=3373540 RepID=UPI003876837D